MRVGWKATALLAFSICAIGRAASAEDATLRAGRDLFEKHCELCHGAEGKGDGPLSDELKVPPADLTGISSRRGGTFPEVEIREIIDGRRAVRAHGKSGMPVWGRVFGGQAIAGKVDEAAVKQKLDQLVAFLRSIQVSPAKTVGSAD